MMIFDDKEEDMVLPWKKKSKKEQELVVSKRLDAMNWTAEQLQKYLKSQKESQSHNMQ